MRYVAIGDSFSEGMGDERADGTPRGWADLVAAALIADDPSWQYANLAIRGRLLEPIVTTQLDAALAMSPPPTLVSLNGGGNDMMRRNADLAHLVRLIEGAVERCTAAGVRIMVLSGADPSDHLPLGRVLRRRAAQLTEAVRDLTERHGVLFVDCFGDAELRRAGYWSADRLHLNAAGHRRVAGFVLAALGVADAEHRIDDSHAGSHGLIVQARYYRQHVLPWVLRRARGRSSGDGRTAKYPAWTSVT
ncbi:SGNH/GDSL hydrolase family protein [Dactylosporangium siamense]|uniref:SGNH hydrolase n=1 Tax=Dactylosporangium siamense TaxID=685454 RepID=A0A919UJG0_9ACTN|nr:SGNH/GDSL hydrolase family protein [Dactylosporangium siamense]GIG52663.1 SGNH hydrolase [Dactylosporangium siamense]